MTHLHQLKTNASSQVCRLHSDWLPGGDIQVSCQGLADVPGNGWSVVHSADHKPLRYDTMRHGDYIGAVPGVKNIHDKVKAPVSRRLPHAEISPGLQGQSAHLFRLHLGQCSTGQSNDLQRWTSSTKSRHGIHFKQVEQ